MESVLAAELTELVHFDSVRIVLLVFLGVVIALLALRAGECNLNSHVRHLLFYFPPIIGGVSASLLKIRVHKKDPFFRGEFILTYFLKVVKDFFHFSSGFLIFYGECLLGEVFSEIESIYRDDGFT